jgi:hypothetical protein
MTGCRNSTAATAYQSSLCHSPPTTNWLLFTRRARRGRRSGALASRRPRSSTGCCHDSHTGLGNVVCARCIWRPASYLGSLGARNWELIQPFKRPLSTCTQSPSRVVTSKRVPLAAVPRTGPFADGVDLMFTPGRCKITVSRFWDAGTVWRVAVFAGGAAASWGAGSKTTEDGTSGQATTGLLGGAGDGSGTLGAAWTGATDEGCTVGANSAVCVGVVSPPDGKRK